MRLALLLLASLPSFALDYKLISGDIALYVLDWTNKPPVAILDMPIPERRGIFLNACSTNREVDRIRVEVDYLDESGKVATKILRLDYLTDASWAKCGGDIVEVERSRVTRIQVDGIPKPVTSATFFN